MRLFPGSCFIYDRQVVDADVRLDGIIFLAIPFAGFFYEVQIVSEAQFPVWRPFHLVNIVDDNLASDIFTIPESFTDDRADNFLHNIVLVNCPGIMCDNYRLPCI